MGMTANRRIALNILATYGRSLFALFCGLVTSRWVLMSLGSVDYGLYGVVGGLTAFVSFFNGLLSGAIGRFYAFSVGEAQKAGREAEGLENCRRWFNVALLVHSVVPVLLVAIGYPCGVWAVENFLTIPPDRVECCVWVWRFCCLSCFVAMVNVPFQAMYTAKQEIAELTVYGIAQTAATFLFMYYMVTHPGDWLFRYALWYCVIAITPQLLITWRALAKYPECRFRRAYIWDVPRMKLLAEYAGGRFLCGLSMMFSNQGVAVLVNKFLGPAFNASMTVANSVSGHAKTLSIACSNAFMPAITNAAGAGQLDRMRRLTLRTCLLSTLAMLIFAVPLGLEIHEVMRLWLKNPPVNSPELCVCLLITLVLDRVTDGHWMAIFAMGRIVAFQAVESVGWFLSVAGVAYVLVCGGSLVDVGIVIVVFRLLNGGIKLFFARRLAGVSIRLWVKEVCVPVLVITACSVLAASVPNQMLPTSFMRICLTSGCSLLVSLPLIWRFVLTEGERDKFAKWAKKRFFARLNQEG